MERKSWDAWIGSLMRALANRPLLLELVGGGGGVAMAMMATTAHA